MGRVRYWIVGLVLAAFLLGVGTLVARRLLETNGTIEQRDGPLPAPVEVAAVEHGPIENRRTFSGALEATARVTISPKVAGRIRSLPLEIADPVQRGQIVAELDDAEFQQSVAQSEAELAVARASYNEAKSAADITQRELDRVETLHERGIASESQLDTARADHLSKSAAVEVAHAQVTRAEASLESARIRLGYTVIHADWEGGDEQRVVAERLAEEGDTVSANTPLLSIIDLDPVKAIIYATERDYALLAPGQAVELSTDAYPNERWEGRVARISPVFREGSRQARVELTVPNEDGMLKPGMFVRVMAVLGREENATIVPVEALAQRDGRDVVFVTDPDGSTARMVPISVGIRAVDRVQVIGDGVEGRVVTLGQQLLGSESQITIAAELDETESTPAAADGSTNP